MRASLPLWLLCAALGCTTPSRPAPATAVTDEPARVDPVVADEIARLEDRRDAQGRLSELAAAPDPLVRARALWALGRVADLRTLETVLSRLTDPAATVRAEAAFAAGLFLQSWDPLPAGTDERIAEALLMAEAAEGDLPARVRMLEALGKSSTPTAEERLRGGVTDPNPQIAARAGLSLGLIARRTEKLEERSVVSALGLLNPSAPQPVRYAGAYVLTFAKAAPARPALLSGLADPDPEVRALCVRGLGEVGTAEDLPALGALLADPDPRVAVEVIRALIKRVERCESDNCPALGTLEGAVRFVERLTAGELAAGNQPLLALAQAGLPPRGEALLGKLRAAVAAALAASPSSDLAWLDCRFAAALDRITGSLTQSPGCGRGLVPEPRRLAVALRELARTPPTGGAEKLGASALSALDHASPLVRNAALELVAALKPAGAAEKIRPLLSGEDRIVAANAALALAALGDRASYPQVLALAQRVSSEPELAPIAEALADLARPQDPRTPEEEATQKARAEEATAFLRPWLDSPHAQVRTSAASALNKLTGQPLRPQGVPFPASTQALPTAPSGATLTFETAKGTFVVKLDTEEAPRTSAHLFALAKRGYFDGLGFHRVVPDFVAQGGDPRGDGEGGPGYSIRCELTHRTYRRGAVGMALSGKDTGGSQFFVTTSAQPHLDGRYTNFGEVIRGMEVVDRLIEGDRMVRVLATP